MKIYMCVCARALFLQKIMMDMDSSSSQFLLLQTCDVTSMHRNVVSQGLMNFNIPDISKVSTKKNLLQRNKKEMN